MINSFIFLPATAPNDNTYGSAPSQIDMDGNHEIFHVKFDDVVWYNKKYRYLAYSQIKKFHITGAKTLVGFSKSAIGAINIALDYPGYFESILIFDSPLSYKENPFGDAVKFYNKSEWDIDLPINNMDRIVEMMKYTNLTHVSGKNFYSQHDEFDSKIMLPEKKYKYYKDVHLEHHWASGWLKYCNNKKDD